MIHTNKGTVFECPLPYSIKIYKDMEIEGKRVFTMSLEENN